MAFFQGETAEKLRETLGIKDAFCYRFRINEVSLEFL